MTDRAGMTLTVLGAATPYPRPDEPCSGFLIRASNHTVWVDAGSGTLAELQRHVALADIDAIWISHLHPDHSSDLLAAWNAFANTPSLGKPIVLGPQGWDRRLDEMLGQSLAARNIFRVAEIRDGYKMNLGDLHLGATQVRHSVPTFGLRAQWQGRLLAYSADSGPGEQVNQLARHADLLVIECGADEPQPYHCTPEEAGTVATESEAQSVILTHIAPQLAASEALDRARVCFKGEIRTAARGMSIQV